MCVYKHDISLCKHILCIIMFITDWLCIGINIVGLSLSLSLYIYIYIYIYFRDKQRDSDSTINP